MMDRYTRNRVVLNVDGHRKVYQRDHDEDNAAGNDSIAEIPLPDDIVSSSDEDNRDSDIEVSIANISLDEEANGEPNDAAIEQEAVDQLDDSVVYVNTAMAPMVCTPKKEDVGGESNETAIEHEAVDQLNDSVIYVDTMMANLVRTPKKEYVGVEPDSGAIEQQAVDQLNDSVIYVDTTMANLLRTPKEEDVEANGRGGYDGDADGETSGSSLEIATPPDRTEELRALYHSGRRPGRLETVIEALAQIESPAAAEPMVDAIAPIEGESPVNEAAVAIDSGDLVDERAAQIQDASIDEKAAPTEVESMVVDGNSQIKTEKPVKKATVQIDSGSSVDQEANQINIEAPIDQKVTLIKTDSSVNAVPIETGRMVREEASIKVAEEATQIKLD